MLVMRNCPIRLFQYRPRFLLSNCSPFSTTTPHNVKPISSSINVSRDRGNIPSVRDANQVALRPEHEAKLHRIAQPFNQLIDEYLNAEKSNILGFNLQPTDLEKTIGTTKLSSSLSKILSLEMCTAAQMRKQYARRVMEMFATGPNDTGSPEVQAGLWSFKIAVLQAHCKAYRHDYPAERRIVYYRDQRRKILRYLKSVSLERYFSCLDRLGLPHDLVESVVHRFPLKKTVRPKTAMGLFREASVKQRHRKINTKRNNISSKHASTAKKSL